MFVKVLIVEQDMFRIVTTVIAFLLVAATATAGSFWQRVSDVAVSKEARLDGYKDVLYLYDHNTFLMSKDHGQSWQRQEGYMKNGVIAVERVGTSLFAFTQHEEESNVRVLKANSTGESWEETSIIQCGKDDALVGVAVYQTGIYAYTKYRKVFASWDGGRTWNLRMVSDEVGSMMDLAVSPDVWVAAGTDGAVWSSDFGITWHMTVAPVEAGSTILTLETLGSTIWAGCRLGSSRFDAESRSWNVVNTGLPVFASLVATPMAIRSIDGVLFGVFKTYNGTSSLMRITKRDPSWVPMQSMGLPPHNFTKRENFTVLGNEVYLYHHGDDAGFLGVYKNVNDAPTSVDENTKATILVSPLPASDHITIQSSVDTPVSATIVNTLGQVVSTFEMNATATVPVADLSVGTYTLLLMDKAQAIATHPIVISR